MGDDNNKKLRLDSNKTRVALYYGGAAMIGFGMFMLFSRQPFGWGLLAIGAAAVIDAAW